MKDFLIIGQGIAGSCVAWRLMNEAKSFDIIDNNHHKSSSLIAAGMWNPIGFKNLTKSWEIDKVLPELYSLFGDIAEKNTKKYIKNHKLIRIFGGRQEENDWMDKCDYPAFSNYMSEQETALPEHVKADFGNGSVKQAGRIVVRELLSDLNTLFKAENCLVEGAFDYSALKYSDGNWHYNGEQYGAVIFCEGSQIGNNPWFSYLPVIPNKGEVFTVKFNKLFNVDGVINKGFFILPLGDKTYRIGASFQNKFESDEPSEFGLEWLHKMLSKTVDDNYEIISHDAGLRPTSPDRKPMIGRHPEYESLYVLNGLGSKGVSLAPYISNLLLKFILKDERIPDEVDINRYAAKYQKM